MDQPTRILVTRAQGRDPVAAGPLYERYRGRLRTALRRMFGSGPAGATLDSEDFTQDAILAALRAIDQFEYRGHGSFLAWLLQVARRQVLQHVRRLRRHKRQGGVERLATEVEPAAPDASPSELAAGNELEAVVLQCIERLEPRERQALLLRRYLDADAAEIQAELDLPTPGAARALLSRARTQLAIRLDRGGVRP